MQLLRAFRNAHLSVTFLYLKGRVYEITSNTRRLVCTTLRQNNFSRSIETRFRSIRVRIASNRFEILRAGEIRTMKFLRRVKESVYTDIYAGERSVCASQTAAVEKARSLMRVVSAN